MFAVLTNILWSQRRAWRPLRAWRGSREDLPEDRPDDCPGPSPPEIEDAPVAPPPDPLSDWIHV